MKRSPKPSLSLLDSVDLIQKINPKLREKIKEKVGNRVADIFFLQPQKIEQRTLIECLSSAHIGKDIIIEVTIQSHHIFKKPYKILAMDKNSTSLEILHFAGQKNYFPSRYPLSQKLFICGKLDKYKNNFLISHPKSVTKKIHDYSFREVSYEDFTRQESRGLEKIIKKLQTEIIPPPEWIFSSNHNRYKIQSFVSILSSSDFREILRIRCGYDELLSEQLTMQILRNCDLFSTKNRHLEPIVPDKSLDKWIKKLPFQLTIAQKKVVPLLVNSSAPFSKKTMKTLLQGDVGSGKTVVAFLTAIFFLEKNKQVAFLAPTNILAAQQEAAFHNLFAKEFKWKTCVLSSSLTKKKKTETLEKIREGEVNFIFGTHALFQEKVEFKNLSFLIIDEQHRFGVQQKLDLYKKGLTPNVLAMSATPIPRSLQMTLYGDMESHQICEKPANRKPIETSLITKNRLPDVTKSVKRALNKGEKIYWICPLVEESEELNLTSVEERYEQLRGLIPDNILLLHGRMRETEKQKSITRFKEEKSRILVSTTVVEVGVDVPDASIIVIENAERFGLAQLHQLRGRVGRGNKQSYCLLLYGEKASKKSLQRLKVIQETEDGFKIAEEDFKMRGAGDLLGTRQSGLPSYKYADIERDYDLLQAAHEDAKEILKTDPKLNSERGKALRFLLKLYRMDKAVEFLNSI